MAADIRMTVHLEPWRSEHAGELLVLVLGERDEIADREPWRAPAFFTLAGQRVRGAEAAALEVTGASLHRVIRSGESVVVTVDLELHSDGHSDREGELGYWVARPFRGRGVATSAAHCLLDEAEERRIRQIRANTLPDNVASLAVLRHLGFPGPPEKLWMDDGAGTLREYLRFRLSLPG